MNDKQYLKDCGRAIDSKIPDNHGFILLVVPFGESPDNRLKYTASVNRDDAINVLREFLFHCGAGEEWMKHIK